MRGIPASYGAGLVDESWTTALNTIFACRRVRLEAQNFLAARLDALFLDLTVVGSEYLWLVKRVRLSWVCC